MKFKIPELSQGRYILGLDVGKARCGLAVAQTGSGIALPLAVVTTEPHGTLVDRINQALAHRSLELLVAGLPLDQRGREGDSAAWVRKLAGQLSIELAVPLELIDERYTTKEAYEGRRQAGLKAKRNRETIDAAAATVILQAFLDRIRYSDDDSSK